MLRCFILFSFLFILYQLHSLSCAFVYLAGTPPGVCIRARLGPLLFVSPLDLFYFYIWNRIFHGRTRRAIEYRAEVVGFIIRFLFWCVRLSVPLVIVFRILRFRDAKKFLHQTFNIQRVRARDFESSTRSHSERSKMLSQVVSQNVAPRNMHRAAITL